MNARRTISLLCFVAFVPSCTHLVSYGTPPVEVSPVHILTDSGERYTLGRPFVEGAEYVGIPPEGGVARFPLESIQVFEVKEIDGGRTAILVTGIVLGALVLYAIGSAPAEALGGCADSGPWAC
jgi:hypothetical protein